MPKPKRPRTKKASTSSRSLRVLQRRVATLEAARKAERERHARQLAAARRAADRKLATLVQELASLRHHQARAEALTRVMGEREAVLAAQAERITRLEGLLQSPTEMR